MAGQRALFGRSVTINGVLLVKEIEEFTPPEVKKSMTDVRGGSFIAGQMMVGIEKMSASLKIIGATSELQAAYGLKAGEPCQVTVKDSLEDEDGGTFAVEYNLTSEIISAKEGTIKQGDKPALDLELAVNAYKKTEAGKVIYEIDRSAQILNLGQGDLLAEHRSNVGLS